MRFEIRVQDKFGDTLRGTISEFSSGQPNITAQFHTAPRYGSTHTPREFKAALERYYASAIDDIENELTEAGFVIISIDDRGWGGARKGAGRPPANFRITNLDADIARWFGNLSDTDKASIVSREYQNRIKPLT